MVDTTPSPLEPCRKKIGASRAKKALAAFVGTCGAATVMTLAINCQGEPSRQVIMGRIASTRIAATSAASTDRRPAATSRPAERTTSRVSIDGGISASRIEATPAPTPSPAATSQALDVKLEPMVYTSPGLIYVTRVEASASPKPTPKSKATPRPKFD